MTVIALGLVGGGGMEEKNDEIVQNMYILDVFLVVKSLLGVAAP